MDLETQSLSDGFAALSERWLASAPRSFATVRSYRSELARWARFMVSEGGLSLSSTTPEACLRYLEQVSSDDSDVLATLGMRLPLKTSSLDQARRIIGAFMLWLATESVVTASVAVVFRRWRPRPRNVVAVHAEQDAALTPEPADLSAPDCSPREQLILGLVGWLGATPGDISKLKARDLRVASGVLHVHLPSGSGDYVWTPAPRSIKKAWQALRRDRPKCVFAVPRVDGLAGLSPSHVAKIIGGIKRGADRPLRMNARRLRQVAVTCLRDNGWTPAELDRHFRRRRLAGTAGTPRDESLSARDLERIASRAQTAGGARVLDKSRRSLE